MEKHIKRKKEDVLIKDVEYYFNKVDEKKIEEIKEVLVSDFVFCCREETRVPFSPRIKRAVTEKEYYNAKSKYRFVEPLLYFNSNTITTDIFFIVDAIGENEFVIVRIERSLIGTLSHNNIYEELRYGKGYERGIAILQSYREFESIERYLHYKDGSITTKKKDKNGVFRKMKIKDFTSSKPFHYTFVYSELNLEELYEATVFANQTGFKEYFDNLHYKNISNLIPFLDIRLNDNKNSCELIAKSNYKLFRMLEADYSLRSLYDGSEDKHVFLRAGNRLKDVIQLPKNIVDFLTNEITELDYSDLNRLIIGLEIFHKEIKNHISLELLELLRDGSRDILSGVDSIRKLLTNSEFNLKMKDAYKYLYQVNFNQEIPPDEALSLWKDYLNMSVDMGLTFNKYPKNLKEEHDLVARDYKYKEEAIIEENFEKRKEELLNLEYSSDKYSIIVPKSTKELIHEGKQLRHCVASYIKDVAQKKTTILFLRENQRPEKPFVTIELKNKSIIQANGFANKPLANKNAKHFLDNWLEKVVLN